jgi:predicted KAP-like P-loop ATPase
MMDILPDEIKILNEIFNNLKSENKRLGAKTLKVKFGKEVLERMQKRAVPLIRFEENYSEGVPYYSLTFEGIAACPAARQYIELLEKYLLLLIKKFNDDPEIHMISSSTVENELTLNKEQSRLLQELIKLGGFFSHSASWGNDDWNAGVPNDIEELVRLGPHEYIKYHRRKFFDDEPEIKLLELPSSSVPSESETSSFNDEPINTSQQDRFGVDHFAKTISRTVLNLKMPVGVTISINGVWGSGKSSAINLVRHYLREEEKNNYLKIVEFKCWWFRGEEGLALAFLQELNRALQDSLSKKTKNAVPSIARTVLQGGEIVGPAVNIATGGIPWGSVVSGSMGYLKKFFPDKGVEDLFKQLSSELEKKNKRYLIIIDDIDRLDPPEVLMVFRLIKSIGRLPNVIYLLAFDRELAEKTVKEKYPSEGPHVLEKIIQVGFELPLPTRDDLNSALLTKIADICGIPDEKNYLRRFMNVFYDAVAPYINTPRDLIRLSNSLYIGWTAVSGEVDVADFVAVETIRLFEPKLYYTIKLSREEICELGSGHNKKSGSEERLKPFLNILDEKRRKQARLVLLRLFPFFEDVGYSAEFQSEWEYQQRICSERHFDTYFRLSISNEAYSRAEVDEFVEHCADKEYVKKQFRQALKHIRKNGKSKVPLLLDELNVNSLKIDKQKVEPLVSSLFEIADDIDRVADQAGGFGMADNRIRINWLVRKLVFDKCTLPERDKIFRNAIKQAQLLWKAYFVTSAIEDYYPRTGNSPEVEAKCLILKESVDYFKENFIDHINTVVANGELIKSSNLLYILFRWRDIANDDGVSVRKWTNKGLMDEKTLAAFAKAFTSYSWTQGMGMFGLGDRVAIRNTRAAIEHLEDIIDKERFRQRLEEIKDSVGLTAQEKEDIRAFLDAWKKQMNPDLDSD